MTRIWHVRRLQRPTATMPHASPTATRLRLVASGTCACRSKQMRFHRRFGEFPMLYSIKQKTLLHPRPNHSTGFCKPFLLRPSYQGQQTILAPSMPARSSLAVCSRACVAGGLKPIESRDGLTMTDNHISVKQFLEYMNRAWAVPKEA